MFRAKIKNKLKGLLGGFDNVIDGRVELALKLTERLKAILTSPVADIITAIIPGNVDNVIRDQLVSLLGKAAEVLAIADSCRQCTSVNEKLDCFLAQLRSRDPYLQDAILQKLASLVTSGLDGRRLKQNLYDLYTQAKYASGKEEQAAPIDLSSNTPKS